MEHPIIQVTPPEDEDGASSESEHEEDDETEDMEDEEDDKEEKVEKIDEDVEEVEVRFCATAEDRQKLLLQRKEELLQRARRYWGVGGFTGLKKKLLNNIIAFAFETQHIGCFSFSNPQKVTLRRE